MQVKVLTYNCHLFKGSTGGRLFPKKVLFEDDIRRGRLIELLRTSEADVVGLQEIWARDAQRKVKSELADRFPYIHTTNFAHSSKAGVLGNTAGLMVLSKYPLDDVGFWRFRRLNGEDGWSSKGVLAGTLRIREAEGGGETGGGYFVRLGVTHTGTDTGHATDMPHVKEMMASTCLERFLPKNRRLMQPPPLESVRRRAGNLALRPQPAIMLGDFNVNAVAKAGHEGDPAPYDILANLMSDWRGVGAVDAMAFLHDDLREYEVVNGETPGYAAGANDQAGNALAKHFAGACRPPTRLDYFFVKRAGEGCTITPDSAEVLRDWTYESKRWCEAPAVSDHYPMMMTVTMS